MLFVTDSCYRENVTPGVSLLYVTAELLNNKIILHSLVRSLNLLLIYSSH